jgi:hypothetical protein
MRDLLLCVTPADPSTDPTWSQVRVTLVAGELLAACS